MFSSKFETIQTTKYLNYYISVLPVLPRAEFRQKSGSTAFDSTGIGNLRICVYFI